MEQLVTDATNISEDAAQLMKFHGSYQQDNREKRTGGKGKYYQFMMRTKQPGGLVTNQLYLTMDDLADQASISRCHLKDSVVLLCSYYSKMHTGLHVACT